ncbi:NACHT, LRR and PYD domains-containing protein 3-like [Neolamprologus brichardi]|uniref:NACHT, LRR and PYD domains-containing protein 3-like n=1 Tax=Neolamprologus brichardi TaxID=32507 RepID=UPI001643D778|nr:NACHT, LRR and PYD domains-containing protein 3-like [Neolamprologus brichardi]
MSQSEEKDEGLLPSNEEHGSQADRERTKQEHSNSTLQSCVSMESQRSRDYPISFNQQESATETKQEQLNSTSQSCVSMESQRSRDYPISFNQQESATEGHQTVSEGSTHHQTDLDSIFRVVEENIVTFVKNELKTFCKLLSPDYPKCLESQAKDEEINNSEDEDQIWRSREAFLKITLQVMRRMKHGELADSLQNRAYGAMCPYKLKSSLKKKFQCVFEGIAKEGTPTLLNQIYTELYITEGRFTEVNSEHEVRQIEAASRKSDGIEPKIKQEDIFKLSTERDEPIRTVMTTGVAGIGKTVLTQKFALDWAEGKDNQDIQFIFLFSFRELNVLKEKMFSLVELVNHFFPEMTEEGICRFQDFRVLFIFDGLDECRLLLDFHKTDILTDVTESTSLDVLLTNIIRGTLLSSACIWITTRPAAANQIPPEYVNMVTEVRGFNDRQKEEYFRKRFSEEEQRSIIISHIKRSRSLHIMCHIPVFCWISAKVLEKVLKTKEGGELPKTLTEMYVHFLVVQCKQKNIKYDGGAVTDSHWSPETKKMIESLAKLAFEQLHKGNLIFYESDLTEGGIDIRAASLYSGVFTQVFQEESGLYQDKMFSFVHLSVQEFLAALHVYLTFFNSGVNLMSKGTSVWSRLFKAEPDSVSLYQNAVDQALQSPNGHLDLFLRFLLGLSLENNQRLLHGLVKETESSSLTNHKTVQYIKNKISSTSCPEKSINLFHCLIELNDCSLTKEIQQHLSSGRLPIDKLSTFHWSALVFILLSSEEELNVFDLDKYSASDEVLLKLLPVVKAFTKAVVSCHDLSERSLKSLASVLSSQSSGLRELDLSYNNLQDSGVKLLCEGLQSPHCKLETLSLCCCNLSGKSCEALASVLSSQPSSLRELDLSNNDLDDSAVMLFCEGLKSPECRLETLRLLGCLITKKGCASVASALNSNPAHLKLLDLSYNHPGESGVKLLSAGRENSNWALNDLRIEPHGSQFLKPVLQKYARKLTLDPNTANKNLIMSNNNRKVAMGRQKQSYPDHPERFDYWKQVLCTEGLSGCCYWEVKWEGHIYLGVTYKGIRRKGQGDDSCLGCNDMSWTLMCSNGGYSCQHGNKRRSIRTTATSRTGVYLDWHAGTLSFFNVTSGKLIHLQTFRTEFKEPVYPAFRVRTDPFNSSLALC